MADPVSNDASNQRKLNVQMRRDHEPTFANSVHLNVSDDAVVLQFLFARPNTDQAQLVSEVVLTPKHAIQFQKTLDETLKKHFTRHLDEPES
ncbi:DUF3467 domain-containing protein [Patescibacteria group bacterium]|jgi:hypothetical protein|nr:DUF3467 domain-containing protein [Patescibacteria group bacterium]